MPKIDKIIDDELLYVKNIGCVVNIPYHEYEEEQFDEINILFKDF